MARYLTVAEWVNRSTGERVQPDAIVDLAKEQAASLVEAGCVVPLREPKAATEEKPKRKRG